jgi:predicted dehydrogenase
MTRRNFSSIAATGAAASMVAKSAEAIRVGFIGVGGMGLSRLKGFLRHADVRAAAICDLDATHLAGAVKVVEAAGQAAPFTTADYRRILERKDIDAVCIATPDHWHALPTVHAAQAGKDVFVEKPLSYSIGEGRAMVTAAAKHQRVTQMGNHIHNELPNYRRVVELVRSGVLGKLQHVHLWKTSETKPIVSQPMAKAPADFDYAAWLGPAPERPYNSARSHFTYRFFWDYSGGMFIDFWCHITDVAYWALDLKAPLSVAATGRRDIAGDEAETPNYMDLVYEYPNLNLTWSLNPVAPAGFEDRGIGCIFQGTDASLMVDYGSHRLFAKGKEVLDFQRPSATIPDSPGHIREFLDAVKSRQTTTCNIDYGHRLTKAGLLGNIAYRVGRKIRWDDAREQVVDDAEANRLVTRKYRKPYRLG